MTHFTTLRTWDIDISVPIVGPSHTESFYFGQPVSEKKPTRKPQKPEKDGICYHSSPCLEYASIIWDPHQTNHITMLEKPQRREARRTSGDYSRYSSVTSMLERLELEPLEERRRIARLTFLYKILHEEVAVTESQLGITRNPRATRGNYTTDKLMVPQCSTTELRQHFVARSIPQWNRLPETVTSADSVPSFKRQLQGLPPRPWTTRAHNVPVICQQTDLGLYFRFR